MAGGTTPSRPTSRTSITPPFALYWVEVTVHATPSPLPTFSCIFIYPSNSSPYPRSIVYSYNVWTSLLHRSSPPPSIVYSYIESTPPSPPPTSIVYSYCVCSSHRPGGQRVPFSSSTLPYHSSGHAGGGSTLEKSNGGAPDAHE